MIEQRRYNHDGLCAKARLGNRDKRFSNRDVLRQLFESVPVQRPNGGRLVPADDVIVMVEPFPAPKVGPPIGLVQTSHQLNAALLEQQDIQANWPLSDRLIAHLPAEARPTTGGASLLRLDLYRHSDKRRDSGWLRKLTK